MTLLNAGFGAEAWYISDHHDPGARSRPPAVTRIIAAELFDVKTAGWTGHREVGAGRDRVDDGVAAVGIGREELHLGAPPRLGSPVPARTANGDPSG